MKILKSNRTNGQFRIIYTLLIFLWAPSIIAAEEPSVLQWEDLIAEGWNPNSVFDELTDEEYASLSDEAYYELQLKAQAMLDAAPTVEALNGKSVTIPGFILPLEFDETEISEFLLVPYYGACVHTPPPPANQVIHGELNSAYAIEDIYEPVWITGKIKTIHSQSSLGEMGVDQSLVVETGYTMEVEEVKPYTE